VARSPLLVEFIAAFGDEPGMLPDGRVLGSSETDWARVFQLIDDSGWHAIWHDNVRTVVSDDLVDPSRYGQTFGLRPSASVQINFWFGDEVLFDIDLREFSSQGALDILCAVIAELGSALDMPVVVSSEGAFDDVVLRYDPVSNGLSVTASTLL
jgi:hypothetical protein